MLYITIERKHPDFPKRLLNVFDAPERLFVRGNAAHFRHRRLLGVVGSRHMSSYGEAVLERFIPQLVAADIGIVSGLAFGVDRFAHELTLQSNGLALGVLGSGISNITPVTNALLGERIATQGLLISEYPGKTPGAKHHFPARNRIIAGLSDALLLIEGTKISGSLITSDFMLQLGRPVFAIPGSIDAPLSEGPNMLIQNGAYPALHPQDLLTFFGIEKSKFTERNDLTNDERRVADLVTKHGVTIDDIGKSCTLPPSTVYACLTTLELKRLLKKTSEGIYIRI